MRLRAPVRALVALLSGLAAVGACAPGDEDLPPTAEERLTDWATLPEGTSVPVALGFGTVVPDSVVAALLERHGLRPYAVHVRAAGVVGVHRRERSRASLEVLAEAREETVERLRTSLCAHKGHARALLAEGAGGADPTPAWREVLAAFLQLRSAQPELEMGAPMIYGVEAVGGLEEVRGAGADPLVTTWEPARRARAERGDTVIVPEPPPPAAAAPSDADVAALSAEEVRARMAELAEDGMGSCTDETRPEEPAR